MAAKKDVDWSKASELWGKLSDGKIAAHLGTTTAVVIRYRHLHEIPAWRKVVHRNPPKDLRELAARLTDEELASREEVTVDVIRYWRHQRGIPSCRQLQERKKRESKPEYRNSVRTVPKPAREMQYRNYELREDFRARARLLVEKKTGPLQMIPLKYVLDDALDIGLCFLEAELSGLADTDRYREMLAIFRKKT